MTFILNPMLLKKLQITHLKQAGDLDTALFEAKSAYKNALEAAENSIKSSKDAIKASENALKASSESKAISSTVDQKMRQLELMIAELKIIKVDRNNSSNQNGKPFLVKLSGTDLNIKFEEGDTPYDDVNLNQSYYTGTIFIPKSRIAKITGDIKYSQFKIAKELKGRVVDNTQGTSNSWTQD